MSEEIKKFIIQEIEKVSEKFNQISFKYGFDKVGKQHIIEVEPNTEFKNPEYMEAEYCFVDAFMNKFPDDDILFISNNKFITIEKVVYVKEGSIKVADSIISSSSLHSSDSLIAAPFSLSDFLVLGTLSNLVVCEPLPLNSNNIVNTEPKPVLNYDNNDFAMAA